MSKKLPDTFKVFVNEWLAETWEDFAGEKIDEGALALRRENYDAYIPVVVLVLTAAVDVQGDRLECQVKGWGRNQESYLIEHRVFYGDPAQKFVWDELDAFLSQTWAIPGGRIACTFIDTGGHHTQQAYAFVAPRQGRRILASKGSNIPASPVISRPSLVYKKRVKLFHIGTDTAKDAIMGRLKIKDPGPGYMHFPLSVDEEYFNQITAERVIYDKGVRKWTKVRERNEALDLEVLCLAGLYLMSPFPDVLLERISKTRERKGEAQAQGPAQAQPAPAKVEEPKTIQKKRPRRFSSVLP